MVGPYPSSCNRKRLRAQQTGRRLFSTTGADVPFPATLRRTIEHDRLTKSIGNREQSDCVTSWHHERTHHASGAPSSRTFASCSTSAAFALPASGGLDDDAASAATGAQHARQASLRALDDSVGADRDCPCDHHVRQTRAVMGAVKEGAPEHEVALASTNAMVREIANSFPFVELMDTWTWFQSGIETDGAHNPVTNKKVAAGDILSLNCFPMIFGYYTAIERTLFCQSASNAHLDLWTKNCEVMKVGGDLMQPGKTCAEIALELNEMYRKWDLLKYRSFGYGHSFGVLCHYYGREAGVELREDVDTVLKPGMVVSMEPMIMIPEGQPGAGGYREHDIFIITDKGAENITNFPYGPEHMIIKG